MKAPTRTFVVAALSLAVGAGGVLAACGDDDDGDTADTLPQISTTTTVPLPPTTAAPVTVAPTTATPSTAAPSTSSTTTSTTSTTVAETTTSTTPPRGTALVLRDDGLGDAAFGAETEEVISYVRSILGPPTADTGWADPFSTFGVCPGNEVRGVTWDDLTLLFSDSSIVTSGRRHFFTYHYGEAFGPRIDPDGPRTREGISVGSTVAELKAAYPGVIVNPADDIFDANFYVNDTFRGFLTGAADDDTVTSITGGVGCGE